MSSGNTTVRPTPSAASSGADRLAEADDAELGRRVGGELRPAVHGGRRGEDDDVSAGRAQAGQRGPDGVRGPDQVDLKDPFELR